MYDCVQGGGVVPILAIFFECTMWMTPYTPLLTIAIFLSVQLFNLVKEQQIFSFIPTVSKQFIIHVSGTIS